MYIYIYVCIYICIYIYINIYINLYTHMCISMNPYVHAHTSSYIPKRGSAHMRPSPTFFCRSYSSYKAIFPSNSLIVFFFGVYHSFMVFSCQQAFTDIVFVFQCISLSMYFRNVGTPINAYVAYVFFTFPYLSFVFLFFLFCLARYFLLLSFTVSELN